MYSFKLIEVRHLRVLMLIRLLVLRGEQGILGFGIETIIVGF